MRKKGVVLFQYLFWSLIYLLRVKKKKVSDRYVDSERLLTVALWGLSKKDKFEEESILWKRKKNQKSDKTQPYFFLKTLPENYPWALTAAAASNRFSFFFFDSSIKILEGVSLGLDLDLTLKMSQ